MRFFCRGRVVEFDRPEYRVLLREMGKEEPVGARAVIVLDIFKVSVSVLCICLFNHFSTSVLLSLPAINAMCCYFLPQFYLLELQDQDQTM